jgi:hypothetical protein
MTGFRIKQSTDDDYCLLGHRVIWYIVTDVSEDGTAHIFSGEDHTANLKVKAASFSENTTIYRLHGVASKVINYAGVWFYIRILRIILLCTVCSVKKRAT